jgi:hypothetical protein
MSGDEFVILLVIGFALLVVIGILVWGSSTKCPKCEKWFSRKELGRNLLNSSTGYETVTRYDITRDKEGKEVSRTQRQEQVRMVYQQYENDCECTSCGNKWTDVSNVKYEG